MLIELLDFAIAVNRYGSRDLPASALSKRKISAASDDQSRAKQSRNRRPIAKHQHARNNHPDELGVAAKLSRALTKGVTRPPKTPENTGRPANLH
jgi:hypothetical protein